MYWALAANKTQTMPQKPHKIPANTVNQGYAMSILPLLPLRALSVTLRFTAPTHFPFYHQPVITAWLRHLVGKTPDYPQYISIDTPEAACIEYPENTCYRFSIFIQPGGGGLLEKIIGQLQNLPHSVKKHGDKLALSDNAQLEQLVDLFSGKTISNAAELSEYDEAALNADINLWQYCPQLSIRTLSPLRILLPKSQRQQHDYKNEARFCRLASEVNFSHLQQRLYDSLNEHLRRKQQASMPPPADKTAMRYRDLFWIDNHYTNSNGKHKPMGGLLGLMQIDSRQFEREQWGCWILGQYLGIGQHRVFGWGRYRLETPEGEYSLKRSAQAHSLLRSATRLDKLQQACEYENPDLQHLESISEQLQQQNYTVPELQGVVLEKTGKKPRPLAIPPSYDRIAQRAVAQSLSPALDSLMYHDSHAYRKQHSRHKAKQSIHLAYQKGYRWIYESDIASYFDTLDWFCMETRLHAFLGDDPLVTQIMRWLTAPVRHEGKRIPRRQGLPQGSPLSPLVSNLMLDAFDSDLETAGYWLIRFADDFVIPCKTKEQAIAAGQTANASLM
ncbi:reverse transcriptase domain-containing protein, partial [Candidatus Venteria ishoeyi]|uniref:reverse transcriptase domain-containing protein n=1 Tax=Candidatus Venteria ishoeyi TaxID=1899563 RepID=UPI0015B35F89